MGPLAREFTVRGPVDQVRAMASERGWEGVAPLVWFAVRGRPDTGTAREQPELPGMELTEALCWRSFWMIAAVQFAFAFGVTGGSVRLVPYLIGAGYAPEHAALVLSLTFGLAAAGKPLMGIAADRIGGRLALALAMTLTAAGQIIVLHAQSIGVLAAFTLIYGLASGAPLALVPDIIAESLGLRRFGTLTGVSGIFTTIGAATGPLAAGSLYDSEHSYWAAFVIFAGILLGGGAAALVCAPLASEG